MARIGIFLPTVIFILATSTSVQAMEASYAMDVEHRVDNLYMIYKYFSSALCQDVCVHIFNDLFLLLYAGMLEHLKIYVLDIHQRLNKNLDVIWVEKLTVCDIQALLSDIDMICQNYSSSWAFCLLKKCLAEVGVSLYQVSDQDKSTVLHYASICSLETLEVLLDVAYGMDESPKKHRTFFEFICKQNVDGETALCRASEEGCAGAVELLLAKVSTFCDQGAGKFSYSYTYQCASYEGPYHPYHKPALHVAVMAKKQDTVVAILDAVICSSDRLALLQQKARGDGQTPLELATKKIKPILKRYLQECLSQPKVYKAKENCSIF